MTQIFALHIVTESMEHHLIGYFSNFVKAETAAIEVAIAEGMERYNEKLWVNPQTWGTVYIKVSPVDPI